jgi:hemolysin activation/secretion protein
VTRRLLLAAASALALAPSARAQSPAEFLPVPRGQTPPRASAPATPLPPSPVQASPGGFTLRGVRLTGATALTEADLAPLWAGLIGRPVSAATLEELATAIGAEYRARGYMLSQAALPAQDVTDGVVTIAVVEGFIDRIAISGGRPEQEALAATRFAPVPADRPLRLPTLERAVLLSRDVLGGRVETVMEPSATTFGAADLTVAITPAPPGGFGTIDNRGSRLYGPWSFSTGITAYDLLGLNERLDLVAAGALDGSLGYVQGAFAAPLTALSGTWADGAMLEAEASYSNGEPDLSKSGAPESQTLTTNETNLSLGVKIPFIRTRAQNLFGALALDWQDSANVTGFGPDETTEDDRLLVLDAHLEWDRADSSGGVTLAELGLRQGLDTSGSFVGGGPSYGADDFTLASLRLSRLQRLGASDWSLWLEGIGQYAFDILPNAERFSLGDSTIGRGFAPGNTTGDSGYGGRLELRRQVPPQALGRFAEGVELYAYGDYGQAYDRDGDRDGQGWETLASAGLGARVDLRPWLTLTPEIARQLEGVPSDTRDSDHETRFYISLVARF